MGCDASAASQKIKTASDKSVSINLPSQLDRTSKCSEDSATAALYIVLSYMPEHLECCTVMRIVSAAAGGQLSVKTMASLLD